MKLYDLIIVFFLILCAVIGFKRGFFKSLITFAGFIFIIVLSYNLKNYLGDFLTLNLPFINFKQFMGGASTLNIVMYQAIAFLVILSILALVYKIIVAITGIFEKILKYTIILGIPSKLLGLVLGLLEGYVIVYLVLFFLTQPFLNLNVLENSNYASQILEKTPLISPVADASLKIINEINDLSKTENANELDLQIADIILKEKVTSKEVMQKLINQGKIKIEGIDTILNKYN